MSTPPNAANEGRPFGREDTVSAIIAAATRLYADRDPSTVSMREIAAEAGVTYGLLHRHFGTKQAILAAVFHQASQTGANQLGAAADPVTGLLELVGLEGDPDTASRFASMLALVVLDGPPPEEYFAHQPAVDVILARAREGLAAPADAAPIDDPRVALIGALLIGLGWHLFGPFLQHALALDERDPAEIRAQLSGLVAEFTRAHLTPPPAP